MPQPITKTQLQNLQQEIKSGGVAAVERAYIDLQSHGYAYGGWGRILAAGDSLSGRAALSYLQGTALMVMGGDQCCHLSRYENDQICIEMATQTFEIYKEIAKNNQDILDRDLNYQEVKDIHEKVFANHKLSLENWALCIPMELIREKYGEQAVENLWQQIRDTGGDGMDAAIITALLTFMEAARTSKISGVREKANLWLARFSDLSEWWDILTKTWNQNFGDAHKIINNRWSRANSWTLPHDPILLDLNGNGLDTIDPSTNIDFDHDADGVAAKTGWAAKDDALLVWDRNTNTHIDIGAELFGDFTPLPNGALVPNGFAALAALDANGDGVIDARDHAFVELRLWRNTSQDGQSSAGELISLTDADIVSLKLSNTLKKLQLSTGNAISCEGSFVRADGSTGSMGEFKLMGDTFDVRFAQIIEVPELLKTLPHLAGSGMVRDLQQAAALSAEMTRVVTQFQLASTRAEQQALLDQLLTKWADTSGMARSLEERTAEKYRIVYEAFGTERRSAHIDTTSLASLSGNTGSTGSMTDFGARYLSERYRQLMAGWRQKMHVLEAFNGQYFFELPAQNTQSTSANWGLAVRPATSTVAGSAALSVEALPTLTVNLSQPQLDLLQQAYDSLRESVYASLVLQTRLKPYLDQIELIIDGQGVRIDTAALDQKLADRLHSDPENYLADLLELDKYASGILGRTSWRGLVDFDQLIETLPRTEGITELLREFHDHLLTAGHDTTQLTCKTNIVRAQEGKDIRCGGSGNDRLSRQVGEDRLSGRAEGNLYVFGRGFGRDYLRDAAAHDERRDTVLFMRLTPDDICVTVDIHNQLLFTIIDTGETLYVPLRGEARGPNGIGRYVFADGSVWSHEDALRAWAGNANGHINGADGHAGDSAVMPSQG